MEDISMVSLHQDGECISMFSDGRRVYARLSDMIDIISADVWVLGYPRSWYRYSVSGIFRPEHQVGYAPNQKK